MNDNNEFDKIIQKMAQNDKSNHNNNSSISKFLITLGGIAVISFFGGTVFMLINMTINNAYPNLHAIKPGIGFMNAARLFFLLTIFFTIFQALKATQKKS
tara:strand:+ start:189 stop:488 length:300 start_codon:yes stop_codon:yes gene_type:complete